MRLIIIEGPRCSGKTMMAEMLKNSLCETGYDVKLLKFDRGDDPLSDMLGYFDNEFLEHDISIIDRFHLTEFVMSVGLQRVQFDEAYDNATAIEKKLYEVPHIVVILSAHRRIREYRQDKNRRHSEMSGSISDALWKLAEILFATCSFPSECEEDIKGNVAFIMSWIDNIGDDYEDSFPYLGTWLTR